MPTDPTLPAEAKPRNADLAAQEVTGHEARCDCRSCWAIRTGFDIGLASGMSSGVATGRAQAAADIRAERERLGRLGYDDNGAWVAAVWIAEGRD